MARAHRGPFVVLLALVLGGGASVLCLPADLCAHAEALRASEDGGQARDPEASLLSCHASREGEAPTSLSGLRIAGGQADECCALRADRPDARTDSRERLVRGDTTPAVTVVDQRLELGPGPSLFRVEGGARPGPRLPAFTLHAALLL